MHKARHGKELVLRMANDVDALAKVSKLIAERGVNILAMSCWEERGDVVMRLVTDDILRTSDVLRENGHETDEKDVVLIDAAHKPGMLRHLTDVLAKHDITLSHLFASATIDQEECLVVLNSSNNERAIVLLNSWLSSVQSVERNSTASRQITRDWPSSFVGNEQRRVSMNAVLDDASGGT